jgi:cobalt-zinc-cadmium resistance protein CzcA
VYALSFIRLRFEYGRDYYFVRRRRSTGSRRPCCRRRAAGDLARGRHREIFRYQLKGPPDMDVMQLKTLQDWVVERRLRIVPGSPMSWCSAADQEYQAEIGSIA